MIKLPYYNDYDVDLIPDDACSSKLQGDGCIWSGNTSNLSATINMVFSVPNNKVNFSIEERPRLGSFSMYIHHFWIYCGDFSLEFNFDKMTITGSYKGTIPGESSVYKNKWNKINCSFSQESDGLHVDISCDYLTLNKVYPDLHIGNLIFSSSADIGLRNIICSDTDDYPSFLYSQRISVDSIDNWTMNDANEYVLTNIDKAGVIHLNQETIDKLLKDYDVIGCYLSVSTNKRGTNMKSLEFKVGDTSRTVEIPQGKGKVLIPLSFTTPSDLQNITLTVRG